MMNIVCEKTYPTPLWNVKEILRYAGCKRATEDLIKLVGALINEVGDKLKYKVCYAEFPLKITDDIIDLEFIRFKSNDLCKTFENCKSVIVFTATVGIEIDRLIEKYGKISPSKAVILDALGAERIEALCDAFCEDMSLVVKDRNLQIKPRFSAGYGDVPLEIQKDIFRVLDCHRKIGVTLNESLLMSPSKSVTALIGLY